MGGQIRASHLKDAVRTNDLKSPLRHKKWNYVLGFHGGDGGEGFHGGSGGNGGNRVFNCTKSLENHAQTIFFVITKLKFICVASVFVLKQRYMKRTVLI